MESRIAIIDYDCLSSVGLSLDETWSTLAAGGSGVGPIDRYDPGAHDLQGLASVAYGAQIPASFDDLAGSPAKFKRWAEPAYHAVNTLTRTVLERLSFEVGDHDPQRIGVIGGTALTSQCSRDVLTQTRKADSKYILNQCHNIPLAIAASQHGLQGPCFSIGSACASSGHAVLLAGQMIRGGLIDAALAFGHEFPLMPFSVGGLDWLNALYRKDLPEDRGYRDPARASRPFAGDRRGFVLAEGAGVALLAAGAYAERHSWPVKGWLRGGYANSDAAHVTRISKDNVARCMRRAIVDADCELDEIECVNAHATSTPIGDRSEMTALGEVFGGRLDTVPVVANKSQVGHSLGAASILELMLATEGMRRNTLLPTLNHVQDPELPTARIPAETTEHAHRLTLSNSFGFGGTNVSLVIERGPETVL